MIKINKIFTYNLEANPSSSYSSTKMTIKTQEDLRLEKIKERYDKINKIRERIRK